ncbi:hypothetical protein C5167_049024 [Papaver somniferum]|uniref:Protein kinase domain-containing protein n=1 Tax=Papaver somniferum TaxID=3469 RepID=A0A4Y7KJL7_PAPSO|nr:serine/threonine-protein kinase-like protein At5g23170 [Papaver somniferum]RZC73543.1 hypothetical protein C5167_049024 [Papaver somniferum]
MEIFSYKEIETATKEFSLSRLIGKGSHGCVYKGVLKGGKIVAVKKPSKGLQILQDNTKLDNEIDILSSLPKTQYIVNIVGVSHDVLTRKKLLVIEFMSNGSLHHSLHNNSANPPTWSKRAFIVLRLARAIQILHGSKPSVIHRDIKSSNILFDSNWNPKLADFGLSVRLANDSESLSYSPSQPAGTIGYLDPSYTTPCKLTKIDVFSFGVVVLEIFSCRRAIDVSMETSSIVEWALPLIKNQRVAEVCDSRMGLLPSNMVGRIQCMLNIAARCVSSDENSRPSMTEIVTELEDCIVERVHFPIWQSLFPIYCMIRARNRGSKTTTIKCRRYPEDVSRGSKVLSVRDILDDEEELESSQTR